MSARRAPLLVATVLSALLAGAQPATADNVARAVVEVRVHFTVQNLNRSTVACPTTPDGATYDVAGWLVAPPATLANPGARAVTLFLHGADGNAFRFQSVPGYDFAFDMARLGRATIVVDRLGYGSSAKPDGFGTCFGSQADVAHQIVTQLRAGRYVTDDRRAAASFRRVAIGGHGPGALIAEVAAYSFGEVDGLVDMAWSDQGLSSDARAATVPTGQLCAAGGEPKYAPDGPLGYAYFPTDDDAFRRLFFGPSADPGVVNAVTAARERDPCGDLASLGAAVDADNANLGTITVPVLLVFGALDAVFPPHAEEAQRARFTGSREVKAVLVRDTGHALYLELHASDVRESLADWLGDHGF